MSMKTFSELLHPFPYEEFLSAYWTKKALFIRGHESKFSDLFSWDALNDLLNRGILFYPRVRLVEDKVVLPEHEYTKSNLDEPEHIIDPVKVIKRLRRGATLIFDSVNDSDKNISDLVNQLQFELGERSHVNLYCSSPTVQGFDLHYDAHEVFLLQIAGQKHWHVFDQERKYPLRYEKPNHSLPPQQPYLDCVLTSGDILYIPRGHWHAGVAVNEPSLHLTLAVTGRTGISFLQWLTEELRSEELWRQNLPLALGNMSTLNESVAKLRPQIERLQKSLGDLSNDPHLIERYIEYCISKEKPSEPFNLPIQCNSKEIEIDIHTSFLRPATQRAFITPLVDGAGLRVVVWGKQLILKGDVKEWVQRLFASSRFSGKEAISWQDDLTWGDVQPVLSVLVKEGIIFIANTNS